MAFVSAGVFIREVDLSQYAARISTSNLGMVGYAERGPVNELTLITSEQQLVTTFGRPLRPDTNTTFGPYEPYNEYAIHAAIQFLRQGNILYFARAAQTSGGTDILTGDTAEEDATAQIDLPGGFIKVLAKTMGRWANASSTNLDRGIRVVTSVAEDTDNPTWFRMEVYFEGRSVEVFDNLSISNQDSNYFLTVVSDEISGSRYVRLALNSSGTPSPGTVYLTGGSNGDQSTGNEEAGLIGIAGDGYRTGAYIFRDADAVDINMLIVPGAAQSTYTTILGSVVEPRRDCILLIDTDRALTPTGAKSFANATGVYASGGAAYNSSYAAVYWPWVQYYDAYNNQKVWTPPSGWVAGQMAYTDRVADPWFAPAGFSRGRLTSALQIEYSPDEGERDVIYAPGQVVNPIVNFVPDGITVWGQKTTQRISSALDRVNVRRMLLYAEKVIATSVRVLVFEPNDPATWRRFVGIVQPVLDSIKARRGLIDFRVICDSTTNTADRIDRNEMYGILLLKPTKAAEVITIDFTLLSTGANFNEATA